MCGGMKGNVNVSDDDAHFRERLILAEQTQLHEIVNTRLLEIGQVFCVVDMSLRVQIPITDFGWMEEFEIGHGGIIQSLFVLRLRSGCQVRAARFRQAQPPAQDGGRRHGGIILLMLPDLQLNDHLRLRKPHPCGSYEWTVVRLGADIDWNVRGVASRHAHAVINKAHEGGFKRKMNKK